MILILQIFYTTEIYLLLRGNKYRKEVQSNQLIHVPWKTAIKRVCESVCVCVCVYVCHLLRFSDIMFEADVSAECRF